MFSVFFAVIGIIGAMPQEVSLLTKDLQNHQQIQIGPRIYHTGMLYGENAIVVYPCIGKVASSSVATTLIHKFNVDRIYFSGMAGVANANLAIGDIVIGDYLVQHDLDARPFFKQFEVPFLDKSHFPADPHLAIEAVIAAQNFLDNDLKNALGEDLLNEFAIKNPKVHVGIIASGDQFISNPDKIKEISTSIPGTLCVEMEGAAVAQVCYENKVPCLIYRIISDKADHSAPINMDKFYEQVANLYSKGLILNLNERLQAISKN